MENLISDLKSISENETYTDMKQALLDLINELEEGESTNNELLSMHERRKTKK